MWSPVSATVAAEADKRYLNQNLSPLRMSFCIIVCYFRFKVTEDCGMAKSSERIKSQHLYHVTFFPKCHFGCISDTFPNLIRNASQMHQKCIRNLSQIQIKTQYFFKISLPYALKLIKYQVSIVKSKFMEINLSKTLQNCCKWLH